MRCFTITDTGREELLESGIMVSETEELIALNAEGGVDVKNTRPSVAIGLGRTVARVPVSAEHATAFQRTKQALGLNALKLTRADVIEDENGDVPMLIKERGESPWLLVHVSLAAGVGGKLWYEDILPDKEFDGWEVHTKPRAFPGPGIKVLAFGCGPQGEPQALLKIARGAGFRIRRTGNLDGLPPVVEVRYKRRLQARPPIKRER